MKRRTPSTLEALEIAEALLDRHGEEFWPTVKRLREEADKERRYGDTIGDTKGDT